MKELEPMPCKYCGEMPYIEHSAGIEWRVYCNRYVCDNPIIIRSFFKNEAIEAWNELQNKGDKK